MPFLANILLLLLCCNSLLAHLPGDRVVTPNKVEHRIEKKLGQGAYGSVYEVEVLTGPEKGQKKAIKIFTSFDQGQLQQQIGTAKKFFSSPEGKTLSNSEHVHHYSSPQLSEVTDSGGQSKKVMLMVTDLANGSLKDFPLTSFDSKTRTEYLENLLDHGQKGLSKFIENGIILGDIKPDNVFVTWKESELPSFTLADYENAERLGRPLEKMTVGYAAPERLALQNTLGSFPTEDIFSFALTLSEVLLKGNRSADDPGRLIDDYLRDKKGFDEINTMSRVMALDEILKSKKEQKLWRQYVSSRLDEVETSYVTKEERRVFKKLRNFITAGLEINPRERWKAIHRNFPNTELTAALNQIPSTKMANVLKRVPHASFVTSAIGRMCTKAMKQVGRGIESLKSVVQIKRGLNSAELVVE